ncbi:MAG: hypothetical protein KJ792_10330 [Actinobacteria bacterium]|nr:hypothetical protein [Actinomycetota bacterium]MCG2803251.1 hypothetical protein [Cellulomonas sp.]
MWRIWTLFALTVVVALATVVALASAVPTAVHAGLYGLVIVGAGLGAKTISTRRRRSLRADRPDSIEHEQILRAAAATLPVSLLAPLALGLWFVVQEWYEPAALLYATVVVQIVAYWVNHARARRNF